MLIRRTLYPLLLYSSLLCTYGCSHLSSDQWSGKDKLQHFVGSAAIAAGATAYAEQQNLSHAQSRNVGLMFTVGLGVAKELYDSRRDGTGWSWKDLAWDIAGAAVGYSIYESMSQR